MKKTKKRQSLLKKLNVLSDDVKKAVISAYLHRCKLKYQAGFSEWRFHTKYNNNFAEGHVKEKYFLKLAKKKDKLFAAESLLFKGINLNDDIIGFGSGGGN